MYVQWLNSEIFPVLKVALVSYRDLNLQNANKMTSIQDHLLYNYLFSPPSNIFYESMAYTQFIFSIFQIDYS